MAAPNIFNKGILLHGIGKGVLQTVSGKVLEMTTSQSMSMQVTATTEDVYGGDSLFPIYSYLSQKEGTIEITEAEFKLSQLSIAQGTEVSASGNKRVSRVLVTNSDTTLPGGTYTGVEVITVVAPDGTSTDKVTVSDTGGLTFESGAQTGEHAVWFKYTDTNAVKAEMLKNAMPEVASFNWLFTTEDQEGNKYQVDLYARRVRCSGEFNVETTRDSASTPTLSIKILDPGDGMNDFAVITVTKIS